MEESTINILFAGAVITILAYLIISNKRKKISQLKTIIKESRRIVYPEYIGETKNQNDPHHNKKNAHYHLTINDGSSMVWAHEEMNAYDSLEMAFTYDDSHDIQQFSLAQQKEFLQLARSYDLSGWMKWSEDLIDSKEDQDNKHLYKSSCCSKYIRPVEKGANVCPRCHKFCKIIEL